MSNLFYSESDRMVFLVCPVPEVSDVLGIVDHFLSSAHILISLDPTYKISNVELFPLHPDSVFSRHQMFCIKTDVVPSGIAIVSSLSVLPYYWE